MEKALTVDCYNVEHMDADATVNLVPCAARFRNVGSQFGAACLVIVDIRMSGVLGVEGLELLSYIKRQWPDTEVIIMTGYGDPDGAELAMRHGVWDYIQKPSTVDALILPLVRALQYREEKKAKQAKSALK